ncbi:HNH endonuclease [Cryptosporangium minutisporangium]|uniref:SMI1/KNR4 family protein n=1 Tax=Cryptosporangium minutisporangium TaxID=113569 RepID=A0ABP6T0U3_9ACTN
MTYAAGVPSDPSLAVSNTLSDDTGRRLPGSRWAARIRPFDSPVLRVRYRGGVAYDLAGLPIWDLLARAVVQLPDPEPGLTVDEVRVADVLTANEVMLGTGDPLWWVTADDYAPLTPPGWVWAHLFGTRRVALVPAAAYGAFRHVGGVATLPIDRSRRGVRVDEPVAVPFDLASPLGENVLDAVERRIGEPLPDAYRGLLGAVSGAAPTAPGVHPEHGFVVDQPFFAVGSVDRHQDLLYAQAWFGDRFTADYLPIGYVQGGVLALRLTGPDAGSVWFADADDPRDDDRYDAAGYCAELLVRCADDLDAFRSALSVVPGRLLDVVDARVVSGAAASVAVHGVGASLPRAERPEPRAEGPEEQQ